MLKIHQHFARGYLLTFVIAIVCVSFISYLALENFYINSLKNELKSIIKVTKPQIQKVKDLQKLALAIHKDTKARVTFISQNGVVLGESNYDYKLMDNHSKRPEILALKNKTFGSDVRFSHTLKGNFLYVSHKMQVHNKTLFVRMAISTKHIRENFMSLWLKIILIFVAAFIISMVFSYFTNKKMQHQISNIDKKLDLIANKHYKTYIDFSFAKEFVDISKSLNKLATQLSKRDKQKRKHAAKLKLLNKQQSQTISAISHEFKNPLAAIIGYANTILEDEDINEKSKTRFLNKIVSNADKINLLIDKLALSVKLENDDLKPNITKFDLSELALHVIEDFKTRFKERVFITHMEPLEVWSDKAFMEIILTNLLDNAIKYSQKEIIITIKNSKCSIEDFGEGIAQDEINKVTKKFYRSSNISWDNSMGLGLAITSYMLKILNSKLQIQSKLNKGSTFSFKLS